VPVDPRRTSGDRHKQILSLDRRPAELSSPNGGWRTPDSIAPVSPRFSGVPLRVGESQDGWLPPIRATTDLRGAVLAVSFVGLGEAWWRLFE
jgi:hypothetical protein